VAETMQLRERAAGRIRLVIPRSAAEMVLMPKLAAFARTFPDIVLEVTSCNDPVDLVADEYDAGVQLGEYIQRDMIAVRVTREMRLAVVGSPAYFKANPIPKHPQELKDHSCIGFRFAKGLYRWEFEKGRKALTVNPQGLASFDDPELVIQAVLEGVGIGTSMEDNLAMLLNKTFAVYARAVICFGGLIFARTRICSIPKRVDWTQVGSRVNSMSRLRLLRRLLAGRHLAYRIWVALVDLYAGDKSNARIFLNAAKRSIENHAPIEFIQNGDLAPLELFVDAMSARQPV
jgi:DNA-binding transcriptional LysR family regulator